MATAFITIDGLSNSQLELVQQRVQSHLRDQYENMSITVDLDGTEYDDEEE